jgi:hypothetical protein
VVRFLVVSLAVVRITGDDLVGELSLETTVTLALLGTVSIGSIILMLMQATKQLFPSLEGQWAIRVTFVYSLFAVALSMHQLGADFQDLDAWISIFLGGCGAFVSAVSQYAFLFKRSVEGLPPPPDAEAPVAAFDSPTEDTGEYPVTVKRMHDEKVRG